MCTKFGGYFAEADFSTSVSLDLNWEYFWMCMPILIRMRMAYNFVLDLGKAAYCQKCQKEYTAKWNTLSKSEFFYIIKKRR